VYGLAFSTKDELKAYQALMEEARKRDHKKIGKELNLFTFSELVGPGLPLWTPKGTILRETLNDYVMELRAKYGYQKVSIPHITKKDLYEKSGHWEKYKDDLFKIETREKHVYAMKPMNCPHHTQIFDSEMRSYRDMPQRYCETTAVYRDEQSGELSGLSRVLCITQDDAHVFCRVNQIDEEVENVWSIISNFYSTFGFTQMTPRLSRRDPQNPDKYLGGSTNWDLAENTLKEVINSHTDKWIDGPGEAAFYGPKIDFMAKDAIGRNHQVATIQLDFVQPERFGLYCINEKGEKETVVMLHVAIMGSIERFLSVIIEHFAGAFPVWMSPVQVF
jgi:threonyl-tRNA synthetase